MKKILILCMLISTTASFAKVEKKSENRKPNQVTGDVGKTQKYVNVSDKDIPKLYESLILSSNETVVDESGFAKPSKLSTSLYNIMSSKTSETKVDYKIDESNKKCTLSVTRVAADIGNQSSIILIFNCAKQKNGEFKVSNFSIFAAG